MKLLQTFVSALVAGVALTFAAGAHAQDSTKQFATVVRVEGEARYSAGDNVWHPLVVGKVLGPGNVLQSAADAKVDLVLGNKVATRVVPFPDKVGYAPDPNVRGLTSYKAVAMQNVVRLMGNTVLAIDKLSVKDTGVDAASETELDLRQGTIFGSVKKLSAASQYTIKTPNGIAGIRGTTFVLSADGKISVSDGSCVISVVINGQTITQTILAGQQFDPASGQVTQLTPQDMNTAEQTAIATFTVLEGVISFANDTTTVYVSPVGGNPNDDNHPAWPF
jgi:hypothetical protein